MTPGEDLFECLALITRLAGLAVAVHAMEALVSYHLFADNALLGWPHFRLHHRLPRVLARHGGILFRERGFMALHVVALGASAALVLAPNIAALRQIALALVLASHLLGRLRNGNYANCGIGAASMRLILIGSLRLRELAPASIVVAQATVIFVAAQAVLAYFVAGTTKLLSRAWREGTALTLSLRAAAHDGGRLGYLLGQHPAVSRISTWAVLVLEIGFPLWLLVGPNVTVGALICAGLMHLAIGHFMGLPQFFWSFTATYPAIILVSRQIQAVI